MKIIDLKKAVEYMNIVKFGAYISRLRKERDMPQSKLADILNVTRQAVSKWERGEGFPDIAILCSIAETFGVTVDTLINAGGASQNEAAILSSVTKNQEISSEVFENKNVIQDIVNIAPYLKVSTLSVIAEQLAKHNIDISRIIELSEFMNDESVVKLFENNNLEKLDDALLEKLIPFLDSDSVHAILDKIMTGQNSGKLIEAIKPYIFHSLIESAILQGVLKQEEKSPKSPVGVSDGTNNIILKNIWKRYEHWANPKDETIAVQDFNLEIKAGEVIAFLGPSGCGKSTTLRMIAGLEDITEGELYIDGKLINDADPKDRGIAMVFQNYALFPHMTVYENIAFGLQPTDMSKDEIREKVEEIAKFFDVTHLFDRKKKQLSGGQQQRVALARAMIREHKIVLLDEPLANLDIKLRSSMKIELIKMHQKFKSTYIYITHNQEEAMTIADRIVVMKDGVIQQVGTPEELYNTPCNIFVAGFLGYPRINFWNSKITEENGSIYVNFDDIKIKLPEDKADKAAAYIDKEVYAGVRPENLHEDEANIKKFKDSIMQIEVEVREYIGDTVYLHFRDYFEYGAVRVSADCTAKTGDKIKIAVNPDKIYLFDKDTEETII